MQSWRIDEREINNITALLTGGFPGSQNRNFTGELEAAFAEKFNCRYAVTFANGTATLHAALVAAGVKPGDEVIVPPLTMASTSLAVLQAGATPVYADIDPETFLLAPAAVEAAVTPKTRALLPVSLYGLPADFDALNAIARNHHLAVIEDDAQCFLGYCRGRIAGSCGDMASFSFQNSKHMTCGEGGIVVTSDAGFAEKLRRFSSLGYGCVSAAPGKSKIDKSILVRPDFIRHTDFGFNYRMSELCSAVALAQLEKLELFVAWRKKCAAAYAEAIAGVSWLVPQRTPEGFENSYWAYTVRLADPEIRWSDFYDKFRESGGEGFYGAWRLTYTEPCFQTLGLRHDCPNAEAIQPRLMQFKTNYGDEASLTGQAKALAETVRYFSGGRG